jgi:hypothetical protein
MKKEKKSPGLLLAYQAERALKEAVAEAIAEHRRNGVPIAIWRDGKVVLVPPDQIGVSDVQATYTLSKKRKKSS